MVSVRSRIPTLIVFAASLLLLTGFRVVAQSDPDPNSPTPVLLSQEGSTRALAVTESGSLDKKSLYSKEGSFEPGSTIVIFATNFQFMRGEGANSLRVLGETKGREYRFPVLDARPVDKELNDIFAITILLRDEIGYWEPPPTGDIWIRLTWRGLASNYVKLGFGGTGGIDEIAGNPTPLSSVRKRASKSLGRSGPSQEAVGYRWSGDRARFLEQAAFGPTSILDNRIRRIGLRVWVNEQFEAQYPSVTNPYPNQPLKPGTAPADCDGNTTVPDVPVTCNRDTYTMYPLQTWFHRENFYGDAQLRHRVSWSLSQIWVTSGVDIQQSRHMVEYHKVLSANAFGNFRNLMKQMTLHPTMGDYLDMARSTKNNPNENYAREIKQLFTIGLFMLNQDGTLQCVEHNPCQVGDTPVPTYDQNVVNNLTKVLTGWTFCNTAASCPNLAVGTTNFIDPMLLNTGNHDLTAKTLLNYPGVDPTNRDIPACTAPCTSVADRTAYANASLEKAMDNIFFHPNVGPFISKNLIQQLVTSDPTPAYVSRVAAVFNNNGLSVRGDLKAVVKAILLDPEARGDVKTDPNFGKLREPVQFAMNILRHFNVRSANGTGLSDGYLNGRGEYTGMGQNPFRSPTVFNYFPPDNIIPGTTLLGPEFALMTTGTSIQRTNFVNRFIFTAMPVGVSDPNSPNGTALDFSDLEALSTADSTGNLLVDELNRRMMHSTMPAAMKGSILTAVTAYPTTPPLNRVRQAIYLVATSAQYQVQR